MTELDQLREENARLRGFCRVICPSRDPKFPYDSEHAKMFLELSKKAVTKGISDARHDGYMEAMKAAKDMVANPSTTLDIVMAAGAVKVPENPVLLDSSRNPDGCATPKSDLAQKLFSDAIAMNRLRAGGTL